MLHIKLISTSGYSKDMEVYYQKLIEARWGVLVNKKTRIIEGTVVRGWNIKETDYEIVLPSETESDILFDLYDVLGKQLILYKENGQPVIEIYDDWRE